LATLRRLLGRRSERGVGGIWEVKKSGYLRLKMCKVNNEEILLRI